jgi:hypothetical protein
MRRFGAVFMLIIATLALTGCISAQPASTPGPAPTEALGSSVRPPDATVTKLLVFVEENHSLAEMMIGMPYAFGLARQFGYATHYRAIGHPSLPNYLAITGGESYGITDDDGPSVHRIAGKSVFGQAIAIGKTAATYADGMPINCATTDGGFDYAVKHNPWVYYTTERPGCQKYDVPVTKFAAAISSGRLPNAGMVIPNLCNDAHNCVLGTADNWFKEWMGAIFAGPDWKSGHLAVVLTADEDDKSEDNTVLTVVIHPSQMAHVVATPLTHYSLSGLFADVLGVPYLLKAATAPSMAGAFGLPVEGHSG